MFYITGDTHRDFHRIEDFCARIHPTSEDVMIILGDAGINYYGGWRDKDLKRWLAGLPLTLFSIHGNHEQRPCKKQELQYLYKKQPAVESLKVFIHFYLLVPVMPCSFRV